MKRILAISISLVMIFTMLVGCSNKEELPVDGVEVNETETEANGERGPSKLTWRVSSDPPTLDPQINSKSVGRQINERIFEGLIKQNYDLEILPGVAETWDVSDDGKTITFNLREDAKWSDGEPVTSKDFEYAWKRGLDPENAIAKVADFFYVENAEAYLLGEVEFSEVGMKFPDDHTVVVEFANPLPVDEALFRLSAQVFFPLREDIIDANPDNWTTSPDKIVSNGPFKMDSYKMNEEIVLVKDENYWDRENKGLLDELKFVIIEDALTALRAFEAGEIDGFDGIPPEEISRLSMESDEFHLAPAIGFRHIALNVDAEPLNNKLVREALVLAIDKEAIADASGGVEIPATGIVPLGASSDGKDFRTEGDKKEILSPINGDIERAQAALAEAGYPNGEGFPEIEYLYATTAVNAKNAEMLQEMWKKNLNIDVDLATAEFKVESERRHAAQFQMSRSSWSGNHLPMTFLNIYTTGHHSNHPNYANPEYDALIDEIMAETDLTKRDELLHKAEEWLMDEFIVAPISYPTFTYVLDKKFKDVRVPATDTLMFEFIYVEE